MKGIHSYVLLLIFSFMLNCQGDDFSPERAFYEDLDESDLVDLIRYSFLEQYGGVELEQKLTMAWVRDNMECGEFLEETDLVLDVADYLFSLDRELEIFCSGSIGPMPDFEARVKHKNVEQMVEGAEFIIHTSQKDNTQSIIAKLDSVNYKLSGSFYKSIILEQNDFTLRGDINLNSGICPIDLSTGKYSEVSNYYAHLRMFYFEDVLGNEPRVAPKDVSGKITRVSGNWLFTTSDGVAYPL